MSIIEDFIDQYQNKISYYEKVRAYAENLVGNTLRDSGIMAITSSRVKDATRLKEKLLLRQKDTNYASFSDIENDIVDFIGVRIALYFPNDQKKVESIIHQLFEVEKTKIFPNEQRKSDIYTRRFSGYCATHYRVFIKGNKSTQFLQQKVRIEIQVASLLMHAWSEVEHDLTYKQKKGLVSYDEYESLDEINGLVIAGEISLQRLQRISELRIASESKPFSNHYLLASYIYDQVESRFNSEIVLGDVETLYHVLKSQDRLTPQKVYNDLQKIDYTDQTPIAQQLIDMYADNNLRISRLVLDTKDQKSNDAESKADDKTVGAFLRSWISLEKTIETIMRKMDYSKKSYSSQTTYRFLKEHGILSEQALENYYYLRKIRNELVHGIEPLDHALLTNCIEQINALHSEIKKATN